MKLKHIEKSETLLINELSKQQELDGKTIFKFGFGQSPFSPPSFLVESLQKHAYRHEYMPVQGLPELRNTIANFHANDLGSKRDPNSIMVAPGSKILIFAVMAALENANVILARPSWVSYAPQAKLLGHSIRWIDTSFEHQWKVTPDALEQVGKTLDQSRPNVMVFNYPGNPTGMSYTPTELQAVAAIAKRYNILVISDEIYGLLTFNRSHESLAKYYPEGTIVTTGLSKWCAAGGWRLGVAILPEPLNPDFKETLLGIASETYSTATAPVQLAAIDAYTQSEKIFEFVNQEKQVLSRLGNWAAEKLSQAGVRIHQPDGGFYLYPDFSNFARKFSEKGIHSSQDLCAKLLEEANVAMLPGVAFGELSSTLTTRLCYVDFDGDQAIKLLSQPVESNEAFVKHFPKIEKGIQAICDWLAN